MKVLACGAIPIARIKMTIAEIQSDQLIEKSEGSSKGFWLSVPRSQVKKLAVGDVISAVCVISHDLAFGSETLALWIHHSESSSEVLYDRDRYADIMRL